MSAYDVVQGAEASFMEESIPATHSHVTAYSSHPPPPFQQPLDPLVDGMAGMSLQSAIPYFSAMHPSIMSSESAAGYYPAGYYPPGVDDYTVAQTTSGWLPSPTAYPSPTTYPMLSAVEHAMPNFAPLPMMPFGGGYPLDGAAARPEARNWYASSAAIAADAAAQRGTLYHQPVAYSSDGYYAEDPVPHRYPQKRSWER